MATGWAIRLSDGEIDVRTVSPTRRAAIVNWLVLNGTEISIMWTDDQIEAAWKAKGLYVHDIEVDIQQKRH